MKFFPFLLVFFVGQAPHPSPVMLPMVTLLAAYGGAVTRGQQQLQMAHGKPLHGANNVVHPGQHASGSVDNVTNIQAQLLSIFPRNHSNAWTGVDATKFLVTTFNSNAIFNSLTIFLNL
jgi:hypothetical protein